jgi:hypothetical protein
VANVKLYPHPDLADRGGIPIAGEYFSSEDAKRLVGQGLAVRTPPSKPEASKRATAAKRSKTPARPAKEG